MYWTVAAAVAEDIRAGRYAVDQQLPTEAELQKRFGVSRHTVRQALRELQEQGYVTTHQGVGSRVRAPQPAFRFVHGAEVVDDLLQFSQATRMHVLGQRQLVADEATAQRLHCAVGEPWLELSVLRSAPGEPRPMGFLLTYLRPEYGGVAALIDDSAQAVFALVEQHYGVVLAEMEQEIASVAVQPPAAQALDVAPGSHGLQVTRRYRDLQGRITQVSQGFYPADRFVHHTKVQIQRGQAQSRAL